MVDTVLSVSDVGLTLITMSGSQGELQRTRPSEELMDGANVPQGSVLVLSNENNTSVVLACVIRRDLLEPNAFVVSQIYISVALLCEEIPSNN